MFLQLLSIEWIRLSRRALWWVSLAICTLYTGMSLSNFYKTNRPELLDGSLKMPGVSFDMANSLDQLLIAIPFLVIIMGNLMGNDYAQRTNQHWLMRAPRANSLLAKFALLTGLTFIIQVFTLLAGWLVGGYYKTYVYHVPNVFNVNWLGVLSAPFYMTLVNLPYIALTLVVAVAVRSTFFGIVIGLGYTQIIENLLSGFFHGAGWTKWLFTNLYFSASFLLNTIGSRTVDLPAHILAPYQALAVSVFYSLLLLVLAFWLYRRQDIGG